MTGHRIQSGDVVRVDGHASVQFANARAITFRIIRIHDWPTYYGWAWLDGYELDSSGEAVERRSIFVQPTQLLRLHQRRRVPTAVKRPAGVDGGQSVDPGRAGAAAPRQAAPQPRPNSRPTGAGPTTRKRDQAAVHRAWTYPQRGSLV